MAGILKFMATKNKIMYAYCLVLLQSDGSKDFGVGGSVVVRESNWSILQNIILDKRQTLHS